MIEHIRVAFGTGVVLGIWHGQLAVAPTTAHFMTYHDGRCSANCKFCPQARGSTTDLKMLSRVVWPQAELKKALSSLEGNSNEFKRLCIQAVNYSGVVDDLCELAARVKESCDLPISVSCQPLGLEEFQRLADVGVERVSVALDAATPELFDEIKGDGYTWGGHIEALGNAIAVFRGKVSTHLIVGLGETEEEMVRAVQFLHGQGITVGLFAFTPIAGAPLAGRPRPDVASYRRIQLAKFFITKDISRVERMRFSGGRIAGFGVSQSVLDQVVDSGEPFRTSGCPDCNRPFYNESPRGPIYNYPRKLSSEELSLVRYQLKWPRVI